MVILTYIILQLQVWYFYLGADDSWTSKYVFRKNGTVGGIGIRGWEYELWEPGKKNSLGMNSN